MGQVVSVENFQEIKIIFAEKKHILCICISYLANCYDSKITI